MKKSLGRKAAALFMAAIMGVASSVCTPSMAVKAESATVTDAEEEIVDVQEEQVEQTEQTAEDEEIIDIEVMAGDIPIDSAHFPDENFRRCIREQFDMDDNGILSESEIKNANEMYLFSEGISSLQGIEYLSFLKFLDCRDNNIKNLDLRKNLKLNELCVEEKLDSLNVSGIRELRTLICYDCNLNELNLNSNYNLTYLECSNNNLSTLNLSSNLNLQVLRCVNNNLSEIEVGYLFHLKEFDCAYNNFCKIDVSKNSMLNKLDCSYNNLDTIDVSKNLKLNKLNCTNNKLTEIDLSKNTDLRDLSCGENNIETLDLRKNIAINIVECCFCNMADLYLGDNKKLGYIYCNNNKLKDLDISGCTGLKGFSCDEDLMKKMNFENNKEIFDIYVSVKLDKNNQYDLSNFSWFDCNKINKVEFGKFHDDFSYEIDNDSFLSGSIINIINQTEGRAIIYCNNSSDKEYRFFINYQAIVPMTENYLNPGIFVMNADRNHYVAGLATSCAPVDKTRLEYSWVAQDALGNFIQMSDWSKSEWVDWTPEKYGTYTIFAKVRVDGSDDCVYTTVGQYDYHPYIKGKCQLPYSAIAPGQPGYLIGVESYENPNQSYQFEMLILDCTLLAQGLPAWTYTTGKFTVPEGNAGWCVWNPQYGYYWTLFRIYDGAGNLIDEYCYPFVNAY